jgi:hypothetical protein
MANTMIDFTGAKFELCGSSCNVLPDGTRINEVSHRRVTLADGTLYEFNRYGWHRWQDNKDYRRIFDSRGHFRKCNDRYSWMLNQGWKENFKEEGSHA